MMFPKIILMVFNGDKCERSALHYAIGLAKQCDAVLECLYIVPEISGIYTLYGGEVNIPFVVPEEVSSSLEHSINRQKKKAHTLFTELVDSSDPSQGVVINWQEEKGCAEDIIPNKGAMADMILMSQAGFIDKRRAANTKEQCSQVVQASIFSTGRPVLVVPPDYEPEAIGRTIAIAWDGNNPHTVHALQAAMPFLAAAQKVYIYTVQKTSDEVPSVESLLHYLQVYDIKAEHVNIQQSGYSVGLALHNTAKAQGVDLLVMGAYSHNRLYEITMGGVTYFMLQNTEIPVLMMH